MNVKILNTCGSWRIVADACRETVGKEAGTGEPSNNWKFRLLKSEHSPIRLLRFLIRIENVKYWQAMELMTHTVGIVPAGDIEFFVRSQRSDRTGISRYALRQDAMVSMQIDVNAQALISISRRCLCRYEPHPETRAVWQAVIDAIATVDPVVARACVPECIYRGACHSPKVSKIDETTGELFYGCGWEQTHDGQYIGARYWLEYDVYF